MTVASRGSTTRSVNWMRRIASSVLAIGCRTPPSVPIVSDSCRQSASARSANGTCGRCRPAAPPSILRHAVRLGSIDGHHGFVAQSQFQGALGLVARMRAVRTLDVAQARTLVERLAALPIVDDRYAGGIGNWIDAELGRVMAPAETMELAVLAAMSGGASAEPKADVRVTWEGQTYRLDLGASERRRLRQVREKQEALPLDLALDVAQAGRR